jgi:hypothetical protein
MSDSNEGDRNLLEFARQVAAIPRRISEDDSALPQHATQATPALEETATASIPPPQPKQILPVRPAASLIDLPPKTHKNVRSPDALAHMILTALQELSDYPGRGFLVTVYGSNPWSAMLTIRPEAGPRIDRALWLARVQDITAQLRKEFDVADEPHRREA